MRPEPLLEECIITLKHARTFIGSREKMHATGIELFEALIERLEKAQQSGQWVPKEITPEMSTALQGYAQCAGYVEEGYRAMLAVAPKP